MENYYYYYWKMKHQRLFLPWQIQTRQSIFPHTLLDPSNLVPAYATPNYDKLPSFLKLLHLQINVASCTMSKNLRFQNRPFLKQWSICWIKPGGKLSTLINIKCSQGPHHWLAISVRVRFSGQEKPEEPRSARERSSLKTVSFKDAARKIFMIFLSLPN